MHLLYNIRRCPQQAIDIIPQTTKGDNEKMSVTKTKTKAKAQSLRELARALHRSPSHICRVMRGKRVSARLSLLLAKRGIKTAKEGK
jgi:hypothetical protein